MRCEFSTRRARQHVAHLFQPEVFASTTLAFATNRSAPAGDAARPWESMRACSVSTLRAPASGWPFSGV